jgi:DedD protein
MRDENARIREKFELSLDGRQVASVVVGALVIVGVVFVLGLNVGRQVATRQAGSARAGDLDALDRAPTAAPAVDGASLTFHDQLVKQKPAPQPSVTAAVAAPIPSSPVAAGSSAAGHPERSAAAGGAESRDAAGGAESRDAAGGAESRDAASTAERSRGTKPSASNGDFTIQIGATQQRSEADRISVRYRSLNPRVETADVQGKGRWYRVRVGSFATREAAERYRHDVSRETGVTGYVTASR